MQRTIAFTLQFLLVFWTGAKVLGGIIGISTAPEDALMLVEENLPAWIGLLLSMPWWVPAGLAVSSTIILFWWARPRVINETQIIRHFEKIDIPYPLRDLGSDELCSAHQHSDGRVTYRFPRRLRCAPSVSFSQGQGVILEISQDHITFEKKADFRFVYDALDQTQADKLESVFGVGMPVIWERLRKQGFDKLIEDYEAILSKG